MCTMRCDRHIKLGNEGDRYGDLKFSPWYDLPFRMIVTFVMIGPRCSRSVSALIGAPSTLMYNHGRCQYPSRFHGWLTGRRGLRDMWSLDRFQTIPTSREAMARRSLGSTITLRAERRADASSTDGAGPPLPGRR